MNSRFRSSLWVWFALCACAAGLKWQRTVISRWQSENAQLHDGIAATEPSVSPAAPENEPPVDSGELDGLRRAVRDLPELRAEISQLRKDRAEIERLETENVALRAAQDPTKGPSTEQVSDL